jgi:hypothetical protein
LYIYFLNFFDFFLSARVGGAQGVLGEAFVTAGEGGVSLSPTQPITQQGGFLPQNIFVMKW